MGMGYDDARHFVSRTGLGTPPSEVARFAAMTRAQAVKALLREVRTTPSIAVPDWVGAKIASRDVLMARMGDPKSVQDHFQKRGAQLKQWWFQEMTSTPSPFTERMTLFWHNHFTSSLRKVRRPELIGRQNLTLRRHALGSFPAFLRAMLRDPAMLVYLDNIRNHARKPNENLARELFELFTLGEGNYTEQDIKEAARALTGATVSLRDGTFRDARWKHDDGEKTVLGKTGRLGLDELVDVVVGRDECAAFVTGKIWREFITTPPSPADAKRIADRWTQSGYDIGAAVNVVLSSEAFWAPSNRATRIKSPVELIVGTVRTLELQVPEPALAVRALKALGQDIFDPPNVKGWPGGTSWITANTLLRRSQILNRAARLPSSVGELDDWSAAVWPQDDVKTRVSKLVLAQSPVHTPAGRTERAWLRSLVNDPTYQLG